MEAKKANIERGIVTSPQLLVATNPRIFHHNSKVFFPILVDMNTMRIFHNSKTIWIRPSLRKVNDRRNLTVSVFTNEQVLVNTFT